MIKNIAQISPKNPQTNKHHQHEFLTKKTLGIKIIIERLIIIINNKNKHCAD